ncbi:MAG: hypothetical protein FJY07_13625 [Bacteroidetes bacterium]|nr:hypothetical protein [Bacteroidota bacterium]
MENNEGIRNPERKPALRPQLLTVLCILTFIGSGLTGFSYLFIYLSYDQMGEIVDQLSFKLPEFDMMLSGGKRFFLSGFILNTLSLIGAVNMWRLRKVGFHFYTGSQIFILILPLVFIPAFPFSVLSVLVTIAFIAGYAVNLKNMN